MCRLYRIASLSLLILWVVSRLMPDTPTQRPKRFPQTTGGLDIFGDVWNFLTSIPGDIAGLATNVWHAFVTFWGAITTVASDVDSGWDWMVNGVRWLGDETVHFAADVGNGVEWLLGHAIPNVFTAAVSWSAKAIQNVGDEAWHLVENTATAIYSWTGGALDALQHALEDAIDFVGAQVTTLSHWVDVAGNWLWGVVSDAAKLVVWFWTQFVVMLLREFWSLVETVGKWLWHMIRSDAKGFVHAVEDVITAIF